MRRSNTPTNGAWEQVKVAAVSRTLPGDPPQHNILSAVQHKVGANSRNGHDGDGSSMSPYLYAASIYITEFGQVGTYGQLLFQMTNKLSNTAFRQFQTLADFTGHPY